MTSVNDEEDDQLLDPAVEQVQRRLRRLMLIAGLTLGIGMFAVFGAIIYRMSTNESAGSAPLPAPLPADAATPTISLSALGLAPEARLLSSALDGDRLALTYAETGGTAVVVIYLPTMAVVSRLRVSDD